MKKIKGLFLFLALMLISLASCTSSANLEIKILNGSEATMRVGEELRISYECSPELKNSINVKSTDTSIATIDYRSVITAKAPGRADIIVSAFDYSATLELTVVKESYEKNLIITPEKTTAVVGEGINISYKYLADGKEEEIPSIKLELISGGDCAKIEGTAIIGLKPGRVMVRGIFDEAISNSIELEFIKGNTGLLEIEIRSTRYYLEPNQTAEISITTKPIANANIELISDSDVISIDGATIRANKPGIARLYATDGNIKSNILELEVVKKAPAPNRLDISISKSKLAIGESAILSFDNHSPNASRNIKYEIIAGSEYAEIIGSTVYAKSASSFQIQGSIGSTKSNILIINAEEIHEDPYVDVTPNEFYRSYEPAKSYMDSYYRTKHGLMSGSIEEQDQAPTISTYQPMDDKIYIKNSNELYEDDGNTYCVVNAYGEVVNRIYKGGAYVTLEEVAAYVYAFAEAPVNQSKSKDMKPSNSEWGRYLRVNNTYFSGDTGKYPYEPELPDISGVNHGGTRYYEMDLGTTGTDCDPINHPAKPYNNGKSITRGAARIVYAKEYTNYEPITNKADKHVFYTYNHYNDFQEYLNYEGGWGAMFGNVTGGGSLSSKNDYNPTKYPEVILRGLMG